MLEVKNLTFQVQENGVERSIVENISFEMLVITGPNGGGKSTLAKVLMGIEKASAGQIILDGEDISNYDINHRADAGIGYAFQQPPRFKGMTVMKLLSLSAGKELKREECCKLLSTVGLCANEYIEREGIKLETSFTDEAYYSPLYDLIHLPKIGQFSRTEEYYSTAFHESVHSTMKKSRCDREQERK